MGSLSRPLLVALVIVASACGDSSEAVNQTPETPPVTSKADDRGARRPSQMRLTEGSLADRINTFWTLMGSMPFEIPDRSEERSAIADEDVYPSLAWALFDVEPAPDGSVAWAEMAWAVHDHLTDTGFVLRHSQCIDDTQVDDYESEYISTDGAVVLVEWAVFTPQQPGPDDPTQPQHVAGSIRMVGDLDGDFVIVPEDQRTNPSEIEPCLPNLV